MDNKKDLIKLSEHVMYLAELLGMNDLSYTVLRNIIYVSLKDYYEECGNTELFCKLSTNTFTLGKWGVQIPSLDDSYSLWVGEGIYGNSVKHSSLNTLNKYLVRNLKLNFFKDILSKITKEDIYVDYIDDYQKLAVNDRKHFIYYSTKDVAKPFK